MLFDAQSVDDEWAKELRSCSLFYALNSRISDDGVRHLAAVSKLALPGSQVTDRVFSVLNSFEYLYDLDLRNTAITDDGLREFRPTREFTSISLLGTQVTDVGRQEFKKRNPWVDLSK